MRYQGRLTDWKDDKGFGFITPNAGGIKVFAHIASFEDRGRRPAAGDLLTYRIGKDARGRVRAEDVSFVGDPVEIPRRARRPSRRPSIVMRLAIVGFFGVIMWHAYARYQSTRVPAGESVPVPRFQTAPSSQFRCDGRTHCSQMTSCEEATYFLRNCPGVMMDGNNDGIPCERQHCR